MRTPARAVTALFTFVVMFVVGTGAALADAPVGDAWPRGEGKSHLDLVILFGGSTVGLFILVALFGLLTARNNYVPPPPSTELETTSGNSPAHH